MVFTKEELKVAIPALIDALRKLLTSPEAQPLLVQAGIREDRIMNIINVAQADALSSIGIAPSRMDDLKTVYHDFKGDKGDEFATYRFT